MDRSYVNGMVDNPADAALISGVHKLARTLGVDVVAEGVEDQRTATALAKLPGTIGQGWHFGRPLTVEGLTEWRRTHRLTHRSVPMYRDEVADQRDNDRTSGGDGRAE